MHTLEDHLAFTLDARDNLAERQKWTSAPTGAPKVILAASYLDHRDFRWNRCCFQAA